MLEVELAAPPSCISLSELGTRKEHTYYDIPMLRPAPWKWEIGVYFFCGALSAGSYLLARLAEHFGTGDKSYRKVTEYGTKIAALAAAPCAPLLIRDLGDPKRFHHMLRVFKPTSPMNLGAWTLLAYSGVSTLALLRELRRDKYTRGISLPVRLEDCAGMPLALLLAGYTGVLLSSTATPVWSRSIWLGPLFSAGALSSGASAISLAVSETENIFNETPAGAALENVKLAAHAAEVVALAGYMTDKGALAEPLTKGSMSAPFWFGVAATAGALFLGLLPLKVRAAKRAHAAGSILSLAGGFALRWATVHAGDESANNASAARAASRS